MSQQNGTYPVVQEEAAQPVLTETQWRAAAEAVVALNQARADLEKAEAQWRLVSAALGLPGQWTIDPFQRTLARTD